MTPSKQAEDDDRVEARYQREHPATNWTTIVVQAIAQILVLGGLAVGYVVTNERWKGGIDQQLVNLTAINLTQTAINDRLRTAIEKLNENIQILSRNQERVIALLETHMTAAKDPIVRQEPIRK